MSDNSLKVMSGYVSANFPGRTRDQKHPGFPAITITRQTGSRATSVGKLLIERYQKRNLPDAPPWTFFGDELINHVLRESNLPQRLARFFPEEGTHSWRETVEEIVGLHPSSFEINRRCHETIVRLFQIGHVIIIGRCGNLLTKGLPNVLRVRLVGSIEKRVAHIAKQLKITEAEAALYLKKEDGLRLQYAKDNFNVSNVDDPVLYDLVINTDNLSDATVADIIRRVLKTKAAKPDLIVR